MTKEDILHHFQDINFYYNDCMMYDDLSRMLDELISDNKGEWIEVVTKRFPNGEKQMWHYDCSVCNTGEPPCPINKEHWDFCPNCGADMREK